MRVQVYINFDEQAMSSADITTNLDVNNVSDTNNLQLAISGGYKGFQLSSSNTKTCSLDGSYKLFSPKGYPGIMSKEMSNNKGGLKKGTDIVVNISGQMPRNLYITFDRACNEYATSMRVYSGSISKTINNDKVTCVIPLQDFTIEGQTSLDLGIGFNAWSRPYASIKITRIATDFACIFPGKCLHSITWSEHSTDSKVSITPGIVEQYADISIYDRDGYIKYAHEYDLLSSASKLRIDTIDDDNLIIESSSFAVSDWDLSGVDDVVDIRCSDPTETFDKVDVESVFIKDRNVDDLLRLAFSYARNYTWRYIDQDTESYCKQLTVPNSWYTAKKLSAQLQNICKLAALRIYWSHEEFVVLRSW